MKAIKHISTIALGTILLLSACSKDHDLGTSADARKDTHKVTTHISLGAEVGTPAPVEQEGETFRAIDRQSFQYTISDGENKFVLQDNGQPNRNRPAKRGHLDMDALRQAGNSLKFFLQVRKVSDKSLVGSRYGTWEYGTRNTTNWRLNGANLTLTGVTPGTDALEVRVVIGGDLDPVTAKIHVDNPVYQELDLSSTNKVTVPVPYASKWMTLSYDAAKQLYYIPNDETIKLKPLGVLLITTVRSTMTNGASLTGVRYVTNALSFVGEFDLTGADNIPFTGSGEKHTMPITGDVYYSTTYKFANRLTPGNVPNNRVIVSWAMSAGKPAAEKWNTQANTRGDLEYMISAPQTHVYAEGVQDRSGNAVTKPNYAVVPIMGTIGNFAGGKSAAINCELYDQPNQVLGYFAQYTVNSSGTGFDKSHDNDKVSLVNWKVAKDFASGKELTGPNGQKAIYKMGDVGQATYMKNYNSYTWGLGNNGAVVRYYDPSDHNKGTISARDYSQLIAVAQRDGTFNVASATRTLMNVYLPRTPKVSYSLMGRQWGVNRTQNINQSVLRGEASYPHGAGKFPIGSVNMKSIYVGKYFVGTLYSPFYKFVAACDESAWTDTNVKPGMVERIFPAGGYYASSSWDSNNPAAIADVDNEFPDNQTRTHVGEIGLFWYRTEPFSHKGPYLMMSRIAKGDNPTYNGAQWLDDDTTYPIAGRNNWQQELFYPQASNGTLWTGNRDARYMWMALLPLANVYQGDEATVASHEN